ncbi:pyruvate ferredoxin oxidoreductase [Candidatus Poribacteria bacterium]|jgi:pyruvate ferredoxin oxidoreductase beta subunit|nr:pyruvate ferredoxin oxidoreductase [Candidatus Poribacteria bacterium]MBT5713451.1 pyruvate ferredoxin oxidoreductase [Candidatus Poribacteria bacterium]MBT7101852.1 pyruvate ferredoxin oxidoreductase [Candidatus Poribacteria bacterium]MBT7807912.1 pyruvate ferredoxin oxidoreductase [Candidatus Poribacteria bacterium]
MALKLRELTQTPELIASGHRACAGCLGVNAVRQVLHAVDRPVVTTSATGCLEVTTTIYPYTAWQTPFIHSAFENVAATASGVERALKVLGKEGAIAENAKTIAFAGDGGTYDIGLQALSGALERGHDFLYVCYNNEAYMNTGIQRSGATPYGASTTTSPAGRESVGKTQRPKNLTDIVVAHSVPYVAQASPHNWRDLATKVKKAMDKEGPAFINILAPCHRGWRYPMEEGINISKMAVDTCVWPLFEVDEGEWNLSYRPRRKPEVADWLKRQRRFEHLFKADDPSVLATIQETVDEDWATLLERCGEPAPTA